MCVFHIWLVWVGRGSASIYLSESRCYLVLFLSAKEIVFFTGMYCTNCSISKGGKLNKTQLMGFFWYCINSGPFLGFGSVVVTLRRHSHSPAFPPWSFANNDSFLPLAFPSRKKPEGSANDPKAEEGSRGEEEVGGGKLAEKPPTQKWTQHTCIASKGIILYFFLAIVLSIRRHSKLFIWQKNR